MNSSTNKIFLSLWDIKKGSAIKFFDDVSTSIDSLKEILSNHWFNKTVNNAIETAEWGVCRNNCGVCKD